MTDWRSAAVRLGRAIRAVVDIDAETIEPDDGRPAYVMMKARVRPGASANDKAELAQALRDLEEAQPGIFDLPPPPTEEQRQAATAAESQ